MNRQEQYNFMLEEDNTMLVEDNEILRTKLSSIVNLIDKEIIEVTNQINKLVNVSANYYLGQKAALMKIRKELNKI